jgi:hypothetical protein
LIKVTDSAGLKLGTPPALFFMEGNNNIKPEPSAKPINQILLLMNSTTVLSNLFYETSA